MNLAKYTALDRDGDVWGRRYGIRTWECLTNPDKGSGTSEDVIENHGLLVIVGIVGESALIEEGF